MNFGFFISLLGWALLTMMMLPRMKAGHALLCAVCGMLFVSYYGVIVLQVMAPVAVALIYGGFAALAAGVIGIALNLRDMRRRVLSAGMLTWLVLTIGAAIALSGCVISDHDSLSYWARIVKELFTYERFPIHMDATMAHQDYIPLLASLQYCVVKVFGWADMYLIYVTSACIICAIAAVVELLDDHKCWAAVLVVMLVYAYASVGSHVFSTRADGPISALFAAGMLCLFMRRDDRPTAWLPSLAVAAVLAGFKIYTGLMLALVIAVSMLISVSGAAKREPEVRRPLLILGWTAVALCLALQMSWSGVYHAASRMADYEAAVATAPYIGTVFEGTPPSFSLTDLFTGNPRNQKLTENLSAESFQTEGALIKQSLDLYNQSSLSWVRLFLLPLVGVWALCGKEERRAGMGLIGGMLIAGLVYLLGLFGSYFVQAETAPAAVKYLITVSTPLLMMVVFLLVRAAAGQSRARLWARAMLPVAAAGLLMLFSPAAFKSQIILDDPVSRYGAMAEEYYTVEIADQLTPEDANKHALLIDCSFAASEIGSKSGITHAYQYYGMPLYVHVLQFPYVDYDMLGDVEHGMLMDMLNYNRCDLLLLRVDDDVYWSELQSALPLEGDWDEPIAVYDIVRENGELSFVCRAE